MKRYFNPLGLAALSAMLFMAPAATEAAVITFTSPVTPGPVAELTGGSETFTEAGFDVEAFWATGVGSGGGSYTAGHFHNTANNEEQHFNGNTDLQGLMIEQVGEGAFGAVSLDYAVRGGGNIDGFPGPQVYILIGTAFNPTGTAASQFTAIPVSGSGTLNIAGFGNVTSLFISSSASVTFDNITLGPAAAPEPATMLLFGAGALGMAIRRRFSC